MRVAREIQFYERRRRRMEMRALESGCNGSKRHVFRVLCSVMELGVQLRKGELWEKRRGWE